ncbi:MAG: long-chain fatty acid--CoA ligase, partial [Holophagales bacterium]|nr:long-chain fatty acid--CoA ligase [Holophagales bacterium]
MSQIFETGPHEPATPVSGAARTLGQVLIERARATPDRAASFDKVNGRWRKTTWQEFLDQASRAARALVDLGLEVGDRVSILGPTWSDWGVYDLGGQLAGVVTVGIYPKQSPSQVRYLLEHSKSQAIFVADDDEMATVVEAADGLEGVRAIVPWDEELFERWREKDPRCISPAVFRESPLATDIRDARQAAIDPEEPAILIYTSGTTGQPKGAMISHANILCLLSHQQVLIDFYQDDLLFSFLPMAHASERVLGFFVRVNAGVATGYASSIGSVLEELPEVRPTIFGSVPRIFEKLYDRVQGEVARGSAVKRAIFRWADGIARRRIRRQLAGESVPFAMELQYRLARKVVFAKIHAAFGGRIRACIAGAAPISYEILEFLWAVGMPVYEAYGMTEATVVTHMNTPEAVRLGAVGRPIPPIEQKIADDGEVLLRGDVVFKGYLDNPEATAEALQNGWLHTGDIGEIDDDGYLRITDRKKHLIITAGGKNVAPANIEKAIKNQSALISQVHAHGDRRAYICALIAPSPIETLEWGASHGLLEEARVEELKRELLADPSSRSESLAAAMAEVVADSSFVALFREPVGRGNRELARVERVRRFFLLDRDFSQEG